MKKYICSLALALIFFHSSAKGTEPNTLTPKEMSAGWKLLFDGHSLTGWHGFQQEGPPAKGWQVLDDLLVNPKSNGRPNESGGDLVTDGKFCDFEFRFEWRISRGGNSGVKYFVDENRQPTKPLYAGDTGKSPVGFEYQVLDDEEHPDAKRGPTHRAGALYDLFGAENTKLKPVGQWNESRILVSDKHVQHWLNGDKVTECDLDSKGYREALATSKYHVVPDFGKKIDTPLSLQDHGDEVAYRNLKIRELKAGSSSQPVIIEDSYVGREPGAAWRTAAAERIERNRKGDLVVRVVDPDGRPVIGATVDVSMQRHAFHFGSQVAANLLTEDSEVGAQYRQHFLELFNYATINQFYYMQWKAPRLAQQSRRYALDAIAWLRGHGIPMHGHVLVWYFKDEQIEKSNSEIHDRVVQHIDETIGNPAIGRVIGDWDVQNEPFQNSDIFRKLGRSSIAEWFRLAHERAPNARLFLNEAGLCSRMHDPRWSQRVAFTYTLAKELQDQSVPIGGLGLQSHHVESLAPIPEVLNTLDHFANLGLELQITEYDIRLIPSTDDPKADYKARWRRPMSERPTPEMEQLEADYLRDYLTACFSHPSVSGFVMWGFWQGRHWLYNAPLLYEDWTLKLAGRVWRDLIFNQWWTQVQMLTDDRGAVRTRGFLGGLQHHGDQTRPLSDKGRNTTQRRQGDYTYVGMNLLLKRLMNVQHWFSFVPYGRLRVGASLSPKSRLDGR